MVTLCRREQNWKNKAFIWKIAVLGREKPRVGAGTSCPRPMLVFYIPPCRKTFTAWRNVKCQRGRGTKCSRTNKGIFHPQNCNFPEESFILISFCYSVAYSLWLSTIISRCFPFERSNLLCFTESILVVLLLYLYYFTCFSVVLLL